MIVRNSELAVDSIRKRVSGLPQPKVFFQIGAKPLFTATKNSFLNDFIEFAGGKNIARDTTIGFYSKEEVLRQDPDVIIILSMDIEGASENKAWQKFTTMTAVKKGRIFTLDSYNTCSASPVTFVEALTLIANILHPEVRFDKQALPVASLRRCSWLHTFRRCSPFALPRLVRHTLEKNYQSCF